MGKKRKAARGRDVSPKRAKTNASKHFREADFDIKSIQPGELTSHLNDHFPDAELAHIEGNLFVNLHDTFIDVQKRYIDAMLPRHDLLFAQRRLNSGGMNLRANRAMILASKFEDLAQHPDLDDNSVLKDEIVYHQAYCTWYACFRENSGSAITFMKELALTDNENDAVAFFSNLVDAVERHLARQTPAIPVSPELIISKPTTTPTTPKPTAAPITSPPVPLTAIPSTDQVHTA